MCKNTYTSVVVHVWVCIYTFLFLQVQITTVLLLCFTVLIARWFNQLLDWWIDCRNRLQITMTPPSLSTGLAEVESATAVSECKFPPRSVVGVDCLSVRSVGSSKALASSIWRCGGLGCLAEKWGLKAHPSLGVKISHWFSHVSEEKKSSLFAHSLH